MAIDVERIAQILRGTAAPLYGVFPRTSSAFDPDFRGFEFDPDQAQALLEEAGQAGLQFELSIGDSDTAREVGQSVQQDLSEIGVAAELNPQPGATLLERLQTGETLAAFTSWFQVLMDPHDIVGNIHYSRGGSNYGRINIPEVDAVIDTALASQDEDERVELYSEVEELLIKEHAVQIPLYRPISTFFISERLRNYYRPPSSGGRYERMWLDE
jgi:peptide/nickel transport system substrate-binding protein